MSEASQLLRRACRYCEYDLELGRGSRFTNSYSVAGIVILAISLFFTLRCLTWVQTYRAWCDAKSIKSHFRRHSYTYTSLLTLINYVFIVADRGVREQRRPVVTRAYTIFPVVTNAVSFIASILVLTIFVRFVADVILTRKPFRLFSLLTKISYGLLAAFAAVSIGFQIAQVAIFLNTFSSMIDSGVANTGFIFDLLYNIVYLIVIIGATIVYTRGKYIYSGHASYRLWMAVVIGALILQRLFALTSNAVALWLLFARPTSRSSAYATGYTSAARIASYFFPVFILTIYLFIAMKGAVMVDNGTRESFRRKVPDDDTMPEVDDTKLAYT